MVLLPIHIKIGLMEFYAKAMTRKISFAVPSKRVSTAEPCKDKIRDLPWSSQRAAMNDGNFDEDLVGTKKTA